MDRNEIRVGDVEMMLVPQSFPAKMLGGDSNLGPSASKADTLPLSYAGPQLASCWKKIFGPNHRLILLSRHEFYVLFWFYGEICPTQLSRFALESASTRQLTGVDLSIKPNQNKTKDSCLDNSISR